MEDPTKIASAQQQAAAAQFAGYKEWQPQQQQGQQPPSAFGGSSFGGRGGGRGRGFQQQSQMGQQGSLQLPQGWQLAYAPTGEPYYVDHNTKTTHWTPPAAAFVASSPAYGGRGAGARGGRGRVGIDQMKRKTKMCMNFESGSCAWGEKCAFAHGAHELTAPINGPQ